MPAYLQKGPTLSLPANKTTQTNVTFGIGNGSDVNFTVIPPTGFSSVYVSTIYRTDWQGNQILYSTARTNLCFQSQTFSGWTWAGSSDSGNTTAPDNVSNANQLIESNTSSGHYKKSPNITVASGSTVTLSIFAKANSRTVFSLFEYYSSKGRYFNLSTGEIGSYLVGEPEKYSITSLHDGWFLCSITVTVPSNQACLVLYLAQADGVFNYLGDGASGLYLFGADLKIGSELTSYIPTTAAPVTVTDYTVSGLTYTLAETPLTGAILSYTGYSYSAYATFDVPCCSIMSISASGLTSGKLLLTASVDGTNFSSTVLRPQDLLTGVLATSSSLPNGLYAINVSPFKSIRFSETNVTDDVIISTALGR